MDETDWRDALADARRLLQYRCSQDSPPEAVAESYDLQAKVLMALHRYNDAAHAWRQAKRRHSADAQVVAVWEDNIREAQALANRHATSEQRGQRRKRLSEAEVDKMFDAMRKGSLTGKQFIQLLLHIVRSGTNAVRMARGMRVDEEVLEEEEQEEEEQEEEEEEDGNADPDGVASVVVAAAPDDNDNGFKIGMEAFADSGSDDDAAADGEFVHVGGHPGDGGGGAAATVAVSSYPHHSTKSLPEHCLVLIGETGQGKSTFVNYQHGIAFEDDDDGIALQPAGGTKVQLVAPIGTDGDSKTRYPTCYDLRFSRSTVSIVDCPGFSDTAGPLARIAHAVNLRNVMVGAMSPVDPRRGATIVAVVITDNIR